MRPVKFRVREVLISLAVFCFIVCYHSSIFPLLYRNETRDVKYVNKCSCQLLNRLSQSLKDFENFPCLSGHTPSKHLQENGRCLRTIRLPTELLLDKSGCVLLKYGRETPICTYPLEEDIPVSRAIITRGMWEEDLVGTMLDILDSNPNMALLDIGCNIGVYTLASALYNHKVVCIEANLENLYLLSRSLFHGKLRNNITIIWNALSEEYKTVILRKKLNNVGGAAIDTKNKTMTGCDIAVNSVRLDDLQQLFIEQKVFMKMDVEGMEHHVLNSGGEFFKMVDVRYVQTEFDSHRGRLSGNEIIDFMLGYGFVPYENCNGTKLLRPAYHSEWPYDVCFIRKTIRKH